MAKPRTIDTHTHILTQETAALLRKAASKVPVTITPTDAESAALDVRENTGPGPLAARGTIGERQISSSPHRALI